MTNHQKQILKADFCILGAGSGGLSFAAGAVQMGASVILLEGNKMGGDCLNNGCVPSKALIAAAERGHILQTSDRFGWTVNNENLKVDYPQVHDHIHGVIAAIAPHDSIERFETLGVRVIREDGCFVQKDIIDTPTYRIKAKRFIIATGSRPSIPPIEGLDTIPFLTNETLFDLKELPRHLVIIGGGPIGMEMAQAFKRLGSQVTVLEAFTILPKDEPEIVKQLKGILRKEGVNTHEQVKITSISLHNDDIHLTVLDEHGSPWTLVGSHVLVATGRTPNIDELNLEAADIQWTPKGIIVDKHLRTTNRRVYAIGDCVGGYQFTHVAGYHAGLAIRNSIFRLGASVQTQCIPWVTYTDPELAHVGALESQLQKTTTPYKVLRLSLKENDRAQTQKRTEGQIKVLVSPKGYILGVTILAPHGGDLIYPWVMAIQNNLKISALANSIAPYPTFSEINKQVAGSFYAEKIFSSSMKKLVRFLMRLSR